MDQSDDIEASLRATGSNSGLADKLSVMSHPDLNAGLTVVIIGRFDAVSQDTPVLAQSEIGKSASEAGWAMSIGPGGKASVELNGRTVSQMGSFDHKAKASLQNAARSKQLTTLVYTHTIGLGEHSR